MCYAINETVEICKKAEGFAGTYYRATVVAAIGYTRYLVRYETRYSSHPSKTKALHLTESVDADEIRPLPPQFSYENRKLNDRVDAFIDDAWRVGRATRFVDPNFYVRLDSDPRRKEHHCPFYKVRLHLEWLNGEWFYCHDDGPQVQNQKAEGGNPNPNPNPNPNQAKTDQNLNLNPNPNEKAAPDRAGPGALGVPYTKEMFACLLGMPVEMVGILGEENDDEEEASGPAGAGDAAVGPGPGPADGQAGEDQPI